jgi:nitroreductase
MAFPRAGILAEVAWHLAMCRLLEAAHNEREDMVDTIEAIHSRRSIRAFRPEPVSREIIEALLWDAVQAPPPFREMVPWTFHVYRGAGRIAAYGRRAKEHARTQKEGGWAERPDFDIFWGAPALIVISGRVEDCCRAGQNLMLSAHARGLGTCWVGSPMSWLRDAAVKAELGIPAEHEPITAICLGYPAAMPEPVLRERPQIVWSETD